jgi:hypothetical protein
MLVAAEQRVNQGPKPVPLQLCLVLCGCDNRGSQTLLYDPARNDAVPLSFKRNIFPGNL